MWWLESCLSIVLLKVISNSPCWHTCGYICSDLFWDTIHFASTSLTTYLYYKPVQNLVYNSNNIHLSIITNLEASPMHHIQHTEQFFKITIQPLKISTIWPILNCTKETSANLYGMTVPYNEFSHLTEPSSSMCYHLKLTHRQYIDMSNATSEVDFCNSEYLLLYPSH